MNHQWEPTINQGITRVYLIPVSHGHVLEYLATDKPRGEVIIINTVWQEPGSAWSLGTRIGNPVSSCCVTSCDITQCALNGMELKSVGRKHSRSVFV